jgi:hypothetical protein
MRAPCLHLAVLFSDHVPSPPERLEHITMRGMADSVLLDTNIAESL